MQNETTYCHSKGYSLVELAIVLSILGIIIAGSTIVFSSQDFKKKYDVTLKNMRLIEDSLTIFLAVNGRLPCPASPSQILTNATFGQEKITADNPQSCNTTSSNINIFSGNLSGDTQYYGAPPVITLGLSPEVMFDGWGKRIGYVVQKASVNNSTTNTSCTNGGNASDTHTNNYFCFRGQASGNTNTGTDDIRIIDVNNNIISDDAVFVLISHGENGYGAFLRNADVDLDGGGTNGSAADRNSMPPSANDYEQYNVNCNPSTDSCSATGLTREYVQNNITNSFDDIVIFKTRNNLLLECNKLGNNSCTVNEGILVK